MILYESRFSGKPLNVSPFQWNNLHIRHIRIRKQYFITNCWFSHDVTKIQTKKLSILPRFYFHDALEQLKTNFHTNFRFKRVLGFVKNQNSVTDVSVGFRPPCFSSSR